MELSWEDDDTLVIEVRAVAQQLQCDEKSAVELLVGFGMGYARAKGFIGPRVAPPMPLRELAKRLMEEFGGTQA